MECFRYGFPNVLEQMKEETSDSLKIHVSENTAAWIIGRNGGRITIWRKKWKGTDIKVTREDGERYVYLKGKDKFSVLCKMQEKL